MTNMRRKKSNKTLWWVGGAIVVALAAWIASPGKAADHPNPRPNVTSADVAPASLYAGYPRVATTYRHTAQIAELVDGVYCYCRCERNAGHYSLLDCFRTDHAAGCDICLGEAALAYRMSRQGASLDAIRSAVDHRYGA